MARRKNTAEAFEILLQIAEEKKKKEASHDPQPVSAPPGEAAPPLARRAVKRAPLKTWQEPLLGSRGSPLAGGSRSRSLPLGSAFPDARRIAPQGIAPQEH